MACHPSLDFIRLVGFMVFVEPGTPPSPQDRQQTSQAAKEEFARQAGGRPFFGAHGMTWDDIG